MSGMVVYERGGCAYSCGDRKRFEESLGRLASAGISVERVACGSIDDIPPGEAYDEVSENGMDALPVCTFDGVVISSGSYPSDQDLADFLDVPDGVLSVDRQKPPSMANDLPPSCCCGSKTR